LTLCGEETLSHAQWFENHKFGVWGAGRLLQFLRLAEPDKRSAIGWKARPRLFQIAKKARPPKVESKAPRSTQDDAILVDMLYGIAVGLIFEDPPPPSGDFDRTEFIRPRVVHDFTSCLLEELGLMLEDDSGLEKPTPLLRELFAQGALKLGKPAKV
jgi:hypothetical protein